MDQWRGKVAVVTGASSGIGAGIAERLVQEGLQVVGFARRSERIEKLSEKLQDKKGKLYAVRVDITKEEEVLKGFKWILENLGPIHILVNNAGVVPETNLTEGTVETWKQTFDTNVLGLCVATREAVRIMRMNQINGHIIHMNSVAGHLVMTYPKMSMYSASKHAVTALTEYLRQELNTVGLKIKITSISPGAVVTNITGSWKEDTVRPKIPFLETEDISDAVLYVLSTPPHVQVHELTIKSVGAKH